MRKKLALAAAALTLAVLPGVIPVRAVSPALPLPEFQATQSVDTFTPLCLADPVKQSRPAPAWLRQSFVGDTCQAPPEPAAIDGFAASREEIVAGMAAVQKYEAAAERFQACVGKFAAAHQGRLSLSEAAVENYRVVLSQRAKAAAKQRIDAAIVAFNEYGSTCPE